MRRRLLEEDYSRVRFVQLPLVEAFQTSWRFSKVRDLVHHPALRRVAVRLPNGAEVRVPRPAGRERLSREMPIIPEMGADTGRIRREFGL